MEKALSDRATATWRTASESLDALNDISPPPFRQSSNDILRIDFPHADITLSIATGLSAAASASTAAASHARSVSIRRFLSAPAIKRLLKEIDPCADKLDSSSETANAAQLASIVQWLCVNSRSDSAKPSSKLLTWRLRKAVDYLEDHLAEPIKLNDLARAAGLSKMYFAAQFRAATGYRPHEFVLFRRIERAKTMLSSSRENIIQIAGAVGFQTQAHFSTQFKRFVGETPARWRSMQQGENSCRDQAQTAVLTESAQAADRLERLDI